MSRTVSVPAPLRDAFAISVVGVVVGLAPLVWYPFVWPDAGARGRIPFDMWIFWFSVTPFAILAMLRGMTVLGRGGAAVLTVVAGFLVVGHVSGLDPDDPSSTASFALVVVPIYACFAVTGLTALEGLPRAFVVHSRTRHSGRDPS